MSVLVVDASVALKWAIDEVHSDAALRLLDAPAVLIAPELLLAEIGSALGRRVGRGELSADEAQAAFGGINRAAVEWWPVRPLVEDALLLANAVRHSIYDCIYVVLAVKADAKLITADRQLFEIFDGGPLSRHVGWIEAFN